MPRPTAAEQPPAGAQHPRHDDVVVDTNVLGHSDNDGSTRQGECLDFLIWLSGEEDRFWTMDDNGKQAPVLDTSLLWAEYNDTLSPVGTAMLLFQQMLGLERVCFASRPDQGLRQRLQRSIPNNKRDRVILGAACTSATKWLVTCDESDFTIKVREEYWSDLGVRVTDPLERAS